MTDARVIQGDALEGLRHRAAGGLMPDLWGKTPVDYALACIDAYEPPEGYYCADSGGKDSTVLVDLLRRAGVKFTAHYSQTGIDPPELTRFLNRYRPETIWEKPLRSFWKGIEAHGLPTRRVRWCCRELKECHGGGRVVSVGVRAEESAARAARHRQVSLYSSHGIQKTFVAPLLNWSSLDVWAYIRERDLPYCELYDQGWERIGCVPCPMNTRRQEQLDRNPGIDRACRRAACRYIEQRNADPNRKPVTMTGEEYYEWWLSDVTAPGDECQMELVYT